MRAPRPGGRSVRLPALDATNRGNRVSLVIGPLELPPRKVLVEALVRIAREAPESPVAYRFDGPDRWRLVPSGQTDWFDALVESVDGDAEDLARRAARLTVDADDEAPVRFVVGRRHLLVSADHSLGDRALLTGLPGALLRVAGGAPVDRWLRRREPVRLAGALARTFAAHPARLAALLRDRGPRTAAPVAFSGASDAPRPETVTVALGRDELRALRRRLRGDGTGATLGTAVLVRLRETLAGRGVPTRDEVVVVQDARRYFSDPPGPGANPITGVPVDVSSGDPARVEAGIRRSIALGRPLAALALGAALARRARGESAGVVRTALPGRARITYSNVGQLRTFDGLPWAPRSGPADILLTVGPLPVGAITVTIALLVDELHVAVLFDAATADRGRIEGAVAAALTPAGAATAARGGDERGALAGEPRERARAS